MERNTNAVFAAFNDQFDADMRAAGCPEAPLSYFPPTPVFTIITKAGPYTCERGSNLDPDDPRPLNFLDVFGRFKDPKAGATLTDCNPFSGKWNFEGIGHVPTETEARRLASDITAKILKLRIS